MTETLEQPKVRSNKQIDDYCEKVLNLCLVARTDGSLMFESVQIIKQLQGEVEKWDVLFKTLNSDSPGKGG